MTAEELEKIISRHEMQCLELKESFNVECIETACAFANAAGGYIVVGLDNNGSPYPVWTSEKGEFCIRFPARTKESAAKLGIDLAKLGLDDSHGIQKEPDSTMKSTMKSTKVNSMSYTELNPTDGTLINLIRLSPNSTMSAFAAKLGITKDGVNKALRRLKAAGYIRRVGPDRGGHWEVVAP